MFNKYGDMPHLGWNPFRQGRQEQQTPLVNPGFPSWINQMSGKPFQIQEPTYEEPPMFQHGLGKHFGLGNLFNTQKQIPENDNTGGPIFNTVYGNIDMDEFYDYLNNYRYY